VAYRALINAIQLLDSLDFKHQDTEYRDMLNPTLKCLSLCLALSILISPTARAENAVFETPVSMIPLAPPLDQPNAEISGLSWCGDKLILLPQYPERFSDDGNSYFYYLERRQIEKFLDGNDPAPLTAKPIQVNEKDLRKAVSIFDGFEGITCEDNQVWLSIEALNLLGGYQSFVVPATISFNNAAKIEIDQDKLVFLASQSKMRNIGDEAILNGTFNNVDGVIALHEVNDKRAVPSPKARHIANIDSTISEIEFPTLPFRITDASALDKDNRFWVINYKYSGDKFSRNAEDALTKKYGEGASHKKYHNVERLLELQINDKTITVTDSKPIPLKMIDVEGRNWEGLARLGNQGFLVATDKHPATLLGFIPFTPKARP